MDPRRTFLVTFFQLETLILSRTQCFPLPRNPWIQASIPPLIIKNAAVCGVGTRTCIHCKQHIPYQNIWFTEHITSFILYYKFVIVTAVLNSIIYLCLVDNVILGYTSSPFLFTDYPLYFFCLQFTAQTVIFDNVARDRYLTKDFNNGLGNEVRPNWRSRNADSSSKLYFDISTIYHALMWHNSSAFLLPVMTFHKEFRLVTLIFKLIQISNRSRVEGSVLMTL